MKALLVSLVMLGVSFGLAVMGEVYGVDVGGNADPSLQTRLTGEAEQLAGATSSRLGIIALIINGVRFIINMLVNTALVGEAVNAWVPLPLSFRIALNAVSLLSVVYVGYWLVFRVRVP